MDFSCLLHLDDYHWNIIISKLSYVDKLNLSGTCKRFFNLIETKQINKPFNGQFKKIFGSQEQISDVIKYFIRKFKAKYFESIEQTDKLYLEYFFSILRKPLTPKLISAHLFWCQRNYLFKEECKLCSQVMSFYEELPTIYLYSKHYSDLWDKHMNCISKLKQKIRETVHFLKMFTTKLS